MKKQKKRIIKKSIKNRPGGITIPINSIFNHKDVERYIDKTISDVRLEIDGLKQEASSAIEGVKNEIIPRMELIDRRDKEQYDTAKKFIVDAHEIVKGRIEATERVTKQVRDELDNMSGKQMAVVSKLTESLNDLHNKIDVHITDESAEFKRIGEQLEESATTVSAIQETLDNVSANGNKGLSASFADMYMQLQELKDVTEGARSRAKFWKVLHDVVVSTPLLKPLRYKWGAILYIAIVVLFLNTILHTLGIQFDLISIFKWIITLGRAS